MGGDNRGTKLGKGSTLNYAMKLGKTENTMSLEEQARNARLARFEQKASSSALTSAKED